MIRKESYNAIRHPPLDAGPTGASLLAVTVPQVACSLEPPSSQPGPRGFTWRWQLHSTWETTAGVASRWASVAAVMGTAGSPEGGESGCGEGDRSASSLVWCSI